MNSSLYTKDMPMVNAQKMRESKERLRERASDYVDELNEKNAAIASEIVSELSYQMWLVSQVETNRSHSNPKSL